MNRQGLLHYEGLRLHVIIDEPALLRPLGSAQVMTDQLNRLAELTASSSITLQVITLATAWPVLT